jgi:hypothetical protein
MLSSQKETSSYAEFQVRLLQSDAVDSHLQTYWNNWFWISKLKTDSATWQWFWAIDCSSQSADNMRVYNYLHHDLFLMIEVSVLLNWINFKSRVWERNESVVISNAFSWLYEFNSSQSSLLSSLMRVSNVPSSSSRSWRKAELWLASKYVLWHYSASYSSIFCILSHLCCSLLRS